MFWQFQDSKEGKPQSCDASMINENIPKLWESGPESEENLFSLLFLTHYSSGVIGLMTQIIFLVFKVQSYYLVLPCIIIYKFSVWLHRGIKARANPCLWASTAGMDDHLFYVPSARCIISASPLLPSLSVLMTQAPSSLSLVYCNNPICSSLCLLVSSLVHSLFDRMNHQYKKPVSCLKYFTWKTNQKPSNKKLFSAFPLTLIMPRRLPDLDFALCSWIQF